MCSKSALTEFECQGLELDWVGLCWGGDFSRHGNKWDFRRFIGSAWQQVAEASHSEFIRNKYRVLLTRAREGLVIWIRKATRMIRRVIRNVSMKQRITSGLAVLLSLNLEKVCRCQKQPWTNTIVRCFGNTMSGRPFNFFPCRLNR